MKLKIRPSNAMTYNHASIDTHLLVQMDVDYRVNMWHLDNGGEYMTPTKNSNALLTPM